MSSTSRFLGAWVAVLLVLAACAEHLAPPGPRIMQAAVADGAFVMPDGMRLPYRTWLPEGEPAAIILALHGMNDSRDAWEYPAPDFAKAGFAVFAPDQRGFGATASRGLWAAVQALSIQHPRINFPISNQPHYLLTKPKGVSGGGKFLVILVTESDAQIK
jgi:cephalosporin-C deacetylase-like acetyl esterase